MLKRGLRAGASLAPHGQDPAQGPWEKEEPRPMSQGVASAYNCIGGQEPGLGLLPQGPQGCQPLPSRLPGKVPPPHHRWSLLWSLPPTSPSWRGLDLLEKHRCPTGSPRYPVPARQAGALRRAPGWPGPCVCASPSRPRLHLLPSKVYCYSQHSK